MRTSLSRCIRKTPASVVSPLKSPPFGRRSGCRMLRTLKCLHHFVEDWSRPVLLADAAHESLSCFDLNPGLVALCAKLHGDLFTARPDKDPNVPVPRAFKVISPFLFDIASVRSQRLPGCFKRLVHGIWHGLVDIFAALGWIVLLLLLIQRLDRFGADDGA